MGVGGGHEGGGLHVGWGHEGSGELMGVGADVGVRE